MKSQKKPRLLIYSDCFLFGGCENVIVNILASARVAEQYDVSFAYAHNRDYEAGLMAKNLRLGVAEGWKILGSYRLVNRRTGWRSILSSAGVLLRKALWASGIFSVYNFTLLFIKFSLRRPDLLYVNSGGYPGPASCRIAVLAAKLAGISPVFFHVNNLAAARKHWYDSLFDKLTRGGVASFITGSNAALERLVAQRGVPRSQVVCIPNTPVRDGRGDLDDRPVVKRARDQRLLTLGVVGLLTARKGHAVLLQALVGLHAEGLLDGVRVVIYGEGEERQALQSLIDASQLGPHVELKGHYEGMFQIMTTFDLLVHPSIANEDFPYVIVEAMELGIPVIGSRVGGIDEQIRNGETGWLVDPSSVEQLRDSLRTALVDRQQLTKLGEQGRRRFYDCFAYPLFEERVLDLLSKR